MSNKSSTNSSFLSNLTCNIIDHKAQITEFIKLKNKGLLYENFIDRFFNYIPIDYNILDKLELFTHFADEAFEFFKLKTDNNKIEITENIIDNHHFTSILLLLDNKPFIVDSINCLLSKLNIKAHYIFHPVIKTQRDTEGKLIQICHETNQGHAESIVHVKIMGKLDQKLKQILKEEIDKILPQIEDIFVAWPIIKNNLDGLKSNIETLNISNKDENVAFLEWLRTNFTFFGFIEYDSFGKITLEVGATSIWNNNNQELQDIIAYSKHKFDRENLIDLGRINCFSPLRQNSLVDYILVKNFDNNGEYVSGTIMFGLYDADMHYQSLDNIPFLRKKFAWVLDKTNFPRNSYNYEKLKIIIESLPKEALIQIDKEDLLCMSMHMLSSMLSTKLKTFIQYNRSASFINILIFLPSDRLTPDVHNAINNYLSRELQGNTLSESITAIIQNYSHLFITLAVQNNNFNFSITDIEQELNKISTNWLNSLRSQLIDNSDELQGEYDFGIYQSIFPYDYQYKFSPEVAFQDLEYLKKASSLEKAVFNLVSNSKSNFSLKIYSPTQELALSDILPSIENLGFRVLHEQTFSIEEASKLAKSWIYEFNLLTLIETNGDLKTIKANVEDALDKMFHGSLANDSLSKLIVLSGFDWLQVKLLKALTRYLHQTGFGYGKGYVQLTLIKHHTYTDLLIGLFWAKFDPQNFSLKQQDNKIQQIISYLENVASIAEDKVLRSMYDLILAITRTNYFQKDKKFKDYISFKFDSTKVPGLPLPLPYAEIFVYSNDFEGIHLRGDKISRGGIRWSDRGEDYRTEVLSLMKAQNTKNSVIVPGGSKGGFFLLFSPDNMIPAEYMAKAVESYKNFLRGLLDITDNIIDGVTVKPHDTIIYDNDDSYIVAAADKGTSSFSDYANSVSKEYNYWLGDAFASGGSYGYDHKKIGITAKGAWISVLRHFEKLGMDAEKDNITVVGIGDMSGDVFGNGLLRSSSVKLVAAFNHKHIFIDPDPDPLLSFKERQRLFYLPSSNWSDYNPDLLSSGGGIYERITKSIELSPQAKKLLNIETDEINPDNLIKAVLKAKVDLIWNGGIGTYIKSSEESHAQVGDKINDNLRCDAKEIQSKVIAEGGNLGVSQLGRIEYSKYGGLINTDFIDNSAGVDCSDHEVNIKIALGSAVAKGKISFDERNVILSQMTEEIEKLVLEDNYKQTRAISIAQLSPLVTMELASQLIQSLEDEDLLNPEVEFIPNKAELAQKCALKEKLTTPENAILLSYSKISVYKHLLAMKEKNDITNDPYFEANLINYFPIVMQEKFKDEILAHPLRREIILTIVTNKIINQLTGPLLNSIKTENSVAFSEIIRAFQVICEIFDLDDLWHNVDLLPSTIDILIRINMFTDLMRIMRRGIIWFLKNHNFPININLLVEEYKSSVVNISTSISDLLIGDDKSIFNDKFNLYSASGASESLASKIAKLDVLISSLDIINIAKQYNSSHAKVASYYFKVGDIFSINWLRKNCDKHNDDFYWNRLLVQSVKDDLYDKQKKLTAKIINSGLELEIWIKNNTDNIKIYLDFIELLNSQRDVLCNMVILANKKLDVILKKTDVALGNVFKIKTN